MDPRMAIRLIRQVTSEKGRSIGIGCVIFLLLSPLLLIVFMAAVIMVPVDLFNEFLRSLLPEQELIYFYEIRPDLILNNESTDIDGYPFGLPINRTVQSHFGDMGSYTKEAIDYLTYNCNGDNIYAIGDGTVVSSEVDQYGGMTIVIEHEAPDDDPYDNWYVYSKYWSLEESNVEYGQLVEKGEIIGTTQSTGDNTSTLIFCFGMWGDNTDDEMVDPIPYIGEREFEEQVQIIIREDKDK